MGAQDFFAEKKVKWVSLWFDVLIKQYPFEATPFFKNTSDPFANPIGSVVKKGLNELYTLLTAEVADVEKLREALDPIIRIQAVQDFSPSVALCFLPDFRRIVESGLKREKQVTREMEKHAEKVLSNIDTAMLMAFDIYVSCTKKLYELRATQFRNSVRQLLIKKDLVAEIPELAPELRF
ncbi:MAG: hypothetical protein GXP53_01295 [Deltaproteobacteria bacterium]|nr:hypothetical protein [Deltaproteobacteria bacterium]